MHSEKIQKKWRQHILSILGACLVCLIAVAADFYSMGTEISSRVYEELSEPEGCESILDEVEMSASNSKLDGLTVTYQKSDPKLMLEFPDGAERKVRTVVLKLEDSFLHEVECTLYFRKKDGNYNENKRDTFTLPAGETVVYFQVPDYVNYRIHELRIDIDEDYTIQDILVSENSLSSVHQVVKSKKAVALYLLVWFAVFECLFCLLNRLCLSREIVREKAAACGKQVLFYAGSALAGNVGAYLLFRVIDREYYGYWAALIGVCSMLLAWQWKLLFTGGFSLKKQGETSGISLRRICYGISTVVFCLLILFMYHEGILKTEKLAGKIRYVFPFLFAVIETIFLSLLYYKNILNKKEEEISFYRAYLFVIFLLGIGYMLVFLPFVSPDEPSHYVSAYRVSNLILGRFGQWGEESLLMRVEDFALFHSRKKALSAYYFSQITDDFRLLAEDSGYVAVDAPMVTNAIFCYAVSGLGIAAARVLHLSAEMTFFAGRFANFLFFMATLSYLMKKIPFGRTALFTIAALPMMLQLMTSYSYDVLTFCFVALFVTQVMCMICADREVSSRDFRRCLIFAVLMAPSKIVYIPLLFLILLVPARNLGQTGKEVWRKRLAVIGTGILVAAVILFVVSWTNEDSVLRQMLSTDAAEETLSSLTDEPVYSLSWILTHLWEYFLMNIRTLVERLDYYFFTMIGEKLGWLDINLPYTYSVVSFVLYLLAVNIRDDVSAEISTGAGRRLWIVVLGSGTLLAVTLMMAISFTPVTYNYVLGVQGRYFLPLLIPGIWILKSRMIQVNTVIRKHIVLIEMLLNFWVLIYVFTRSIMKM